MIKKAEEERAKIVSPMSAERRQAIIDHAIQVNKEKELMAKPQSLE
jgi:hypothetical protein